MVVASANPEDYTSRGRIITPLKDRYAAQVRTHYPETRDLELQVVRQEARVPAVEGIRVFVPEFMAALIGEITLQARSSPDVNQTSGVSVRVSISNYETLIANAVRRAIRCGEEEAVPRVSDLDALVTSTAGKLELEYAGEDRSEGGVVRELIKRATRIVFEGVVPVEGVASVVESFNQGWNVEVSAGMPAADYLEGLDEIGGLREAASRLVGAASPERLASAIELILEGLHLSNRLNKVTIESGARYTSA
jgi:magnesium chelatase subunit I